MNTRMNSTSSTGFQMVLMALQYMRGRKLRTALTTLAIVFGVALLFGFNITLPGAMDTFKRSLTAATGTADLTVSSVTGEAFLPDEPLQKVLRVPGVEAASGILRRPVSLPRLTADEPGAIGKASQIELVGIDPVTAPRVREYAMSEGRFLEAGDTGKAVLPAAIADFAPQLTVGTTFPLITSGGLKFYTVVGLLAESGNLSTPQIIISLSDAQAAFNQPGVINAIDISFQAGADHEGVTAAVQAALGSNFTTGTVTGGLDAVASLQVGYAMFNVLGFIALFLGAFLIFNTFRTVVVERRRDLGMLRAIGATRRQIMQLILIESLLQGGIGTLMGLVAGYGMALLVKAVISNLLTQISSLNFDTIVVSPGAILGAIVPGIVMVLLAGYFPARTAGRVSPIEALRPVTASRVRQAARWSLIAGGVIMALAVVMLVKGGARGAGGGAMVFLIGMVVAAPGLVVPAARLFSPLLTLWYAREGDIARGNLIRQPGRAAITASTLMIGLATLIMMVGMVRSLEGMINSLLDRNFVSDLLLLPPSLNLYGSVLGADESLSARLRELPDVDTVAGLRYASSSYNGKAVQVLGIDPANYPKVAQLEFSQGVAEEAFSRLSAGRYAIVNGLGSAAMQVQVGSEIVLPTAEGPQTYRVIAIADDLLSFKINTVFISQDNLKADFNKAEDVLLMMTLKPGADKAAVLKQVQAILKADYPQFSAVITGEYRTLMLELMTGGMQAIYGLAVIILIPAALGLLNTLTINVLERTREIGVVRAVGGSRTQIRRMVGAESLLLGLFGAATGVLAGVAMSYGFTAVFDVVGWKLPYELPVMGIIAAIVVAVLLALFASILPARNAARLDIIRALQYE